MTVSIRRMTLGSGYKYLMGSVAQSDGASQHALSDFLTQALGWGCESTRRLYSQVPKYEVAGVSQELQKARKAAAGYRVHDGPGQPPTVDNA